MNILDSFLFWLPCAFGFHSPRHGRCLWCRKPTYRRGWAK